MVGPFPLVRALKAGMDSRILFSDKWFSMNISSYEYSAYTGRTLVFQLHIVEHLGLEDAIIVSKQRVCQFLRWFKKHDTIAHKPGSGFPRSSYVLAVEK